MIKRKSFVLVLFLGLLLVACNSNPLSVNLTNEDVNLEFINADKQLYNASIEEVKDELPLLTTKLGDLFLYELSNDMQKNITDTSYKQVYDYYHAEYIAALEQEKIKLYPTLPAHEQKINKAFQYLAFHFGDSILPKQVFYINKLFSQINCSDVNISVGLENYISPESDVIKSLPPEEFYQWQRKRMDIDYLERDVLLAWIQVHLFNDFDGKFAEHIIQAGKVLYILNATFPNESEAYILRYSDEAYGWAMKNEGLIWNYLVKEQMLFDTDIKSRINFLNEGPTTVGLNTDSPDRIGQYLGYKIVKGFMNKNKTLSLRELLDTGYNNILQTYKID